MTIQIKDDNTTFLENQFLISKKDPDYKYTIQLTHPNDIKENEKISIPMFKTMMTNSNRKKYSCKLLSYILDVPYEVLLKQLRFGKNELDKTKERDKGERANFVAHVNDSNINIEINCNGKDKVKYVCYLKDEENVALTNKLIVIQIYIPNLVKKWYTSGVENKSLGERFLLVLALPDIDTTRDIRKGYEIMEEYIDEATRVSNDDNFRDFYSKEWEIKDLAYDDGKYDGIIEGKAEGRAEEKCKIVKKMLEKKMDINLIMEVTGLSKKEIETYQQ